MVESGRTMKQAINDGTAFQLKFADRDGHYAGDYFPPACESLDEVIAAFRSRYKPPVDAVRCEGQRLLKGSTIGCTFVESVREVALSEING